jgi:hypothetical protein
VHVRSSVEPEIARSSETDGSTVRLMAPPEAVKGPIVVGVAGRFRVRPAVGTGLGIGALMAMVPLESDAGVAPVASTLVTAEPEIEEFPSAVAADTIELGRATMDW